LTLEVANTTDGWIWRFAQQLCGRHNALRQAKKAASRLNLLARVCQKWNIRE